MNIFKRLINVITLGWCIVFLAFLLEEYFVYEKHKKESIKPPEPWIIEDSKTGEIREYFPVDEPKKNYPFDYGVLIVFVIIALTIQAVNYILFKKLTLWHKT